MKLVPAVLATATLLSWGVPAPQSSSQPPKPQSDSRTWQQAYGDGVAELSRKPPDYAAALRSMQRAKALRPDGGRNVRGVGSAFLDYLPDYYLGQALQGLSRHEEAIAAFREATKVIRQGDREYADLNSRLSQSEKAEQDRKDQASLQQRTIEFNRRLANATAAVIEGRLDDALREATAARDLGVNNASADTLIDSIKKALDATKKPTDPTGGKPPDPPAGGGAGGTTGGAGGTTAGVGGAGGRTPPVDPYKPPPDRNKPRPGPPPRGVAAEQAAVALYLAGQYKPAADALESFSSSGQTTPRVELFLASSRAAMVLTGQTNDAAMLARERQRFAALTLTSLAEDLKYISPRVIQFLRGQ